MTLYHHRILINVIGRLSNFSELYLKSKKFQKMLSILINYIEQILKYIDSEITVIIY